MSATTASSAVAFASSIASASRALSLDARTSLVSALSSIIDAGFFLRTRANGRRLSPTVDPATEISDVLRAVHLSTLESLYPGEAPVTTRAHSLAMRSSRALCAFGACEPLLLNSPPLGDDHTNGGAFDLSAEALAEVARLRTSCGADRFNSAGSSADFGIQAVRWANPFSTAVNLGDAQFPSSANSSVSSLSFTACGDELAVTNLSAPVKMVLPIARPFVQDHSDEFESVLWGSCKGTPTVVRCKSWEFNLTCPSWASTWNVTCPRIVPVPACVFWDGAGWSNYGVTVTNVSSTMVYCTSSHLTNYLGIVGETATGVEENMATYGHANPADLRKVVGFLCFMLGCYFFVAYVTIRDFRRMRTASQLRSQEMWESAHFRASVERISDRDVESEAQRREPEAQRREVLDQVAKIESHRALALEALRNCMIISPKEAFGHWAIGLVERHKILAAFGNSKPSYERAPGLLMELLSFCVGCALLHVRRVHPALPVQFLS